MPSSAAWRLFDTVGKCRVRKGPPGKAALRPLSLAGRTALGEPKPRFSCCGAAIGSTAPPPPASCLPPSRRIMRVLHAQEGVAYPCPGPNAFGQDVQHEIPHIAAQNPHRKWRALLVQHHRDQQAVRRPPAAISCCFLQSASSSQSPPHAVGRASVPPRKTGVGRRSGGLRIGRSVHLGRHLQNIRLGGRQAPRYTGPIIAPTD